MYFEINGEKGSVKFVFERMNEIQYFDAGVDSGVQGWSTIQASEGVHPYWANWWPTGHVIGYDTTFVHEIYEFIQAVANDRPCVPDFYDGMKVAQILEAVDRSIEQRAWVKVDEV
jgi:predicted dehydrogenase